MQRKIKPFIPLIFLGLAILFYLGKAVFPGKDGLIYGWDFWRGTFYYFDFFGRSLRNFTIPFWDPYSYAGTPMLSHPAIQIYYPLNILYVLFPVNIAYSFYIAIHLFIAGYFMYRLMVRQKCDAISALTAAAVYSFSGFVAGYIYAGHSEIPAVFAWAPLVFDSMTSLFDKVRRKDFMLAVFGLSMQMLGGFYDLFVIYTLELVFSYYGVHILFNNKKGFVWAGKKILIFFVPVVMAIGISAAQLVPVMEYSFSTIRQGGIGYDLATAGSYTIGMFQLLVNPYAFGNPFTNNPPYTGPGPNYFGYMYYIGILPVLLVLGYFCYSLAGFIKRRKIDPDLIFYGVTFIYFSLMALGNNFFLHKLVYDSVPFYRFFRTPLRHLTMVVFLAAFVSGIASAKIKYPAIRVVLLILIAYSLISFDKNLVGTGALPTATHDQALIRFLQHNSIGDRVYPRYYSWESMRDVMDSNAGPYYRVETITAYNAMPLGNFYRFIDLLRRMPSGADKLPVELYFVSSYSKALDYLGVKYVLNSDANDDVKTDIPGKFKMAYSGAGYKLYENLTSYPRFFLAENAKLYSLQSNLEQDLIGDSVDLRKTILLPYSEIRKDNSLTADRINGIHCSQAGKSGNLRTDSYTPNTIKLSLYSDCDTFLATSEVFYPDWKARIDGKPVPVLQANGAFRSVFIPRGKHMVEFFYDPAVFIYGIIISLTALTVFAVISLKLKHNS